MLYYTTLQHPPDWIWDKTKQKYSRSKRVGISYRRKMDSNVPHLNSRTEDRYHMGTTATKVVIKYWIPQDPNTIKYCVTAKID